VIERRPIRVGLVGCGNIAVGRHIPAYLALPDLARVVAVADPTPARREMAVAALGLPAEAAYDDGLDLLENADIDVVDVCTPPSIRMPVLHRALEDGTPILCEKPVATVPAEAADLVERSARAGVPIGVIQNFRFLPELVRAREIIDAGEIGDPEVVILQLLGVEDRPGAAAYRPDWRHLAAVAGGGVLMDMVHVVYVAEMLLGRPIQRVSAHVDAREPGSSVEDLALARFETDEGVALVNVGWGVGPGGIAVSGSLGRIEIVNEAGATTPFRPPEELRVTHADGSVRREPFGADPDEPAPAIYLTRAIREFLESVAAGRPPVVDVAAGAHVLEVAMATYESAALGRTVSVPLDRDDPVYRLGIAGLRELATPPWSPLVRHGLFGFGETDREGT
jgi:predicted dehydrogenase